ncbi:MAG: hypothetical protein ACFBSG_19895 [Leptolyngbyaceae cyanobacterium]
MVNLPIPDSASSSDTTNFRIAEFEFDPGWVVGEEIHIKDASLTRNRRDGHRIRKETTPRFSFLGQVIGRRKIVEVDFQDEGNQVFDKYTLAIELEVADKEQIPDMVAKMNQFFAR